MRDSTLIELLFSAASVDPLSWSSRLVHREPAKRLCRGWGDEQRVEELFREVKKELNSHGVRPFVHFTKRKFLELSDESTDGLLHESRSLFSGLAAVPITVVRKQFGVVSAAPLSDYAFILKRYHEDVAVGDMYVVRDEYEMHQKTIHAAIKKFHTHSATEMMLQEDKD